MRTLRDGFDVLDVQGDRRCENRPLVENRFRPRVDFGVFVQVPCAGTQLFRQPDVVEECAYQGVLWDRIEDVYKRQARSRSPRRAP